MSRGKLKPEDEKNIQNNYEYLKSELEALDLLDNLFQNKVITLEDKIRINSGKTKSDRNEDLLLTILHSGPGASFSCFLLSLLGKYPHVRKRLKSKDGVTLKTIENVGETDGLKLEVDKIEIIVKEKNYEIQQLKDECEHLRKRLGETENDEDDVQIKTCESAKDCIALRQEVEHLRNVVNDNVGEIQQLMDESAKKDVEIENLNKQLTEVIAERDEYREQHMALIDDNKQLKRNLANRIDIEWYSAQKWRKIVRFFKAIESFKVSENNLFS